MHLILTVDMCRASRRSHSLICNICFTCLVAVRHRIWNGKRGFVS